MAKKKKEWYEGEIILAFGLTKITNNYTPILSEWLTVDAPIFDAREQGNFEYLLLKTANISTWSEDDLKMKFISPVWSWDE